MRIGEARGDFNGWGFGLCGSRDDAGSVSGAQLDRTPLYLRLTDIYKRSGQSIFVAKITNLASV